jgi:hypothetical protein
MKGLTGVVNNSKTRLVKRKLGHSYAIFRGSAQKWLKFVKKSKIKEKEVIHYR